VPTAGALIARRLLNAVDRRWHKTFHDKILNTSGEVAVMPKRRFAHAPLFKM
jgi:hypothetical protein